MDPLQQLLSLLGEELHLKLHIDHHSSCSIRLSSNLIVQLQLNDTQEDLLLFAKLGEVPPGKFRENFLTSALKANGGPDPIPGILGYIGRNDQLALFQSYPLRILEKETLLPLFGGFVAMAVQWRDALERGIF